MSVDPIDEGDAFTAASLNSRFADVRTTLNALTRNNLRPRSLRDAHFTLGVINGKNTIGNSVTPSIGAAHTYDNEYPGYNTDTFADPPTGSAFPTVDAEWNVILGNATKARKTFTGIELTMASSGVAGLLVLGNVEVEWYWSDGSTDSAGNRYAHDEKWAIATAIMYLDSAGTWHIIPRTERFLTQPVIPESNISSPGFGEYVRHFRDKPRRHLIVDADIIDGAGTIHGVQMVAAIVDLTTNPGGAFVATSLLELWQFSLTVVPLYAKAAP